MRYLKILIFTAFVALKSAAADSFPGPITAQVLRVVDGDTLEIEAPIWPQQWVRTAVRIRGIDAPEIRGANCEAERRYGLAAKARVEELLGLGEGPIPPIVTITQIELGKYGGRHVADVVPVDGRALSEVLVREGLAQPWPPASPKPSWCLPRTEEQQGSSGAKARWLMRSRQTCLPALQSPNAREKCQPLSIGEKHTEGCDKREGR